MWKIRNIVRVEVIVIIQGVPKNIAIGFYIGSNYLYHYRCYRFSIKQLAEKFKKPFTCFGENTEKCITFTVPIEKEITRIDKNGEQFTKDISCRLQFIESVRFIVSSWQDLWQILQINILKELIKLNLNMDTMIKNVNAAELILLSHSC